MWTASDAELVRRARAGRHEAFESLVERYQRKAHAVARAHGVRGDVVADVVQDSFLRAFRGLDRLQDRARFGGWFLTIVRNAARTCVRRTEPEAPALAPEPAVRDGDRLEAAEVRERLWREVDRLPEGTREAIFLYYYEGPSSPGPIWSCRPSSSGTTGSCAPRPTRAAPSPCEGSGRARTPCAATFGPTAPTL